jgi:2-oxoglutarate/2-oxoacid ferredoxin oxidoreductase subunit beta
MSLDRDDEASRELEEDTSEPTELESALANDTLRDAINQTPLVVDAETTLAETIGRMQAEHRGCALVLDGGQLAGIFTERDVLMRVAGRALDLERTAVSACMTPAPVTLPADASVAYALHLMVLEGFRHIPVVDEAGQPTAVVSMRELIEYLSEFFNRGVLNLPPEPHVKYRSREGA